MTGDEYASEEADWLLNEARSYGAEISRRTLVDWHTEGLIPKPFKRGLGRGLGSKSLYPAGTLTQVLTCHALFRKFRNKERVGWELWVRGFENVDDKYSWTALEKAHAFLLKFAEEVQALEEDDDACEQLLSRLHSPKTNIKFPNFLKRVRQRLGRQVLEFAPLMLSVAAGDFGYFDPKTEDGKHDKDLLSRALNLEAAGKKKTYGDPFFIEDLTTEFARVTALTSDAMKVVFQESYLAQIGPQKLREATAELYLLFGVHSILSAEEKRSRGRVHPVYRLLPVILEKMTVENLACLVLVWSTLREIPEFKLGVQRVREAVDRCGIDIEDISIV